MATAFGSRMRNRGFQLRTSLHQGLLPWRWLAQPSRRAATNLSNASPPDAGTHSPVLVGRGRAAVDGDVAVYPLGLPDSRFDRFKIGLLTPSTNTACEAETWEAIWSNQPALAGVGCKAVTVRADPAWWPPVDKEVFLRNFTATMQDSAREALSVMPHSLLLSFDLSSLSDDLARIMEVQAAILDASADVPVVFWQEAVAAGLRRFGATKIAVFHPFTASLDASLSTVFEAQGFEVVRSAAFGCATAADIPTVPDSAKAAVILQHLAGPDVDAIVQSGTGMSSMHVAEQLEAQVGVPILSTNATMLWHALRQGGIDEKLHGCTRLLREH